MLGQLLAALGSAVGKMSGGGIISTILRFAGKSLGNYLTQKYYTPTESFHYRPQIDDITPHSDTNGRHIPIIFGKMRVNSCIIWALNFREIPITNTDAKYFPATHNIKSLHHKTYYLYYADFALAICEGIVERIDRVWIDGQERDISEYKFRFYDGSDGQKPDIFIEAAMGMGKTPAFRGLSYIIFENFPLAEFGNKIPNFSFEVTRKPKNNKLVPLQDMIKNIVIIPGSGEFLYDTILQEKIHFSSVENIELYREYINCHNSSHLPDSLYNLDQLQSLCSNLEWAAPLVCWFADSLDASRANIFPAIEYNDNSVGNTEPWNVAGINRDRARIISKDRDGNPNYGGTVNDASLLRYLDELKSRNIKIMLYPIICLDIEGKPWRGHITSNPDGIRRFFNDAEGYKNFILHYAKLAHGKVDAFIIGSELKSLTNISDGNIYPAVEELIDLAHKVKHILGPSVIITYAADWSEYHHNAGIYNLDPLWACSSIDVVGIDAYFPITNSTKSNIEIDDIKNGWQSGEGWDYYFNGEAKLPLNPEWAWKNIEYWWRNIHINADGKKTPWIPRSKKIWFTEFGFPSIDKAPNQPNIFFDPVSIDGGVPKYSSGEVDFAIQKKSIQATIEFWQASEFVERMFLWTWDARPYPAWPHGKIWRDSNLWLKGHSINGKISMNILGNIILELCERAGIDGENVIIDTINDDIDGILIDDQSSILDLINCLRIGYFFDIKSNYLKEIEFIKRGIYPAVVLESNDLVNHKKIIDMEELAPDNNLGEITISFRDHSNSYNYNIVYKSLDYPSNSPIYYLNFPVTMDEISAKYLAEKILYSSRLENQIFRFTIMATYLLKISTCSVISLQIYDNQYRIRISDVEYEKLLCHITGVIIDESIYQKPLVNMALPSAKIELELKPEFEIFELPISLKGKYGHNIYAAISQKHALYSLLHDKIKLLDLKQSVIGTVVKIRSNPDANQFLIDDISEFTIHASNWAAHDGNTALIGKEIVYFRNCQEISKNIYLISGLIRGVFHSSQYIDLHMLGDKFILLDSVSEISISDIEPMTSLKFSADNIEKTIEYQVLAAKSLRVENLRIEGDIMRWVAIAKYTDYWRSADQSLEFILIIELPGLIEEYRTKKEFFAHPSISAAQKISIMTIEKGLEISDAAVWTSSNPIQV